MHFPAHGHFTEKEEFFKGFCSLSANNRFPFRLWLSFTILALLVKILMTDSTCSMLTDSLALRVTL